MRKKTNDSLKAPPPIFIIFQFQKSPAIKRKEEAIERGKEEGRKGGKET